MNIVETIQNNLLTVISIPIIAALIGWITNYIAVKMIFRPKNAVNILGIKIQGLVPKRQKDLAKSMGEMIQRDLVSHHDVTKILQGNDIKEDVFKFIDGQIDIMLTKFLAKNPMFSMFLAGDTLKSVKEMLSAELQSSIPGMMDNMIEKVEGKLDFAKIVEDKINSFDLTKLEEIVYRISSTELKTIEYLGGVLGFIVGILQVAIMLVSQ